MINMLLKYFHKKISLRENFSKLKKEDQQKLFLYHQYLDHLKNTKMNAFYVFYRTNYKKM
jgi:hypothetical protein